MSEIGQKEFIPTAPITPEELKGFGMARAGVKGALDREGVRDASVVVDGVEVRFGIDAAGRTYLPGTSTPVDMSVIQCIVRKKNGQGFDAQQALQEAHDLNRSREVVEKLFKNSAKVLQTAKLNHGPRGHIFKAAGLRLAA